MSIETIKLASALYILGAIIYGFWKGFLPHDDGRTLKDMCEDAAEEVGSSYKAMYIGGYILLVLVCAMWPFWLIEGTIRDIKNVKRES